MKKFKSVSAVVICLCLIASIFAGCSKISLEGQWKSTFDLSDSVTESWDMTDDAEVGQYYDKFSETLFVDVIYTFDKDNNYTCAVDEEKLRADLDALADKVTNYVAEGMYKYVEDNGESRADLDAYYEEDMGITLYDDLYVSAKEDCDQMFSDIVEEFTESEPQLMGFKGDRIYQTDEKGNELGYQTYTLEGDTLTITGEYDMQDNPVDEESYPIIATRIS